VSNRLLYSTAAPLSAAYQTPCLVISGHGICIVASEIIVLLLTHCTLYNVYTGKWTLNK